MTKLYTKQTWVDETLAAAERYNILTDAGASVYSTVQLVLSTAIAQAGTAADAAHLNHIEDGLDAVDSRLDTILGTWAASSNTLHDASSNIVLDGDAGQAHMHQAELVNKATPTSPASGATRLFVSTAGLLGTVNSLGAVRVMGSADGWTPAGETWTRFSASAVKVSGDLTGKYMPGMRVRLVQGGSTKYFIVTLVAYSSPDTTLTLYGGTDYTLPTGDITEPHYSAAKAPYGFPLDPNKWTIIVTDDQLRTQASPTLNTWYNNGGLSINIPKGCWRVSYQAVAAVYNSTAGAFQVNLTLSTGSTSESDVDFTSGSYIVANSFSFHLHREKLLTLANDAVYYLNECAKSAAPANIYLHGTVAKTIIRAVCAFL